MEHKRSDFAEPGREISFQKKQDELWARKDARAGVSANPARNRNFLDYLLLRSEVCIFEPVLETFPLYTDGP